MKQKARFLKYVRSHFDKLLYSGRADFGKTPSRMWLASLDTRTGKYPVDDTRPPGIPRRHYRAIDAPRGCNIYWDIPSLVAAHNLSKFTRDPRYSDAADDYVEDFLSLCVARNGVFLWGNHYYWDAFSGAAVKFKGNETPQAVDFSTERGDFHETRPVPPAWELFWRVSPRAAGKAIREAAENSVFNRITGGFNRHADGRKGCAFLESGGILVESLCWLYSKTGDGALLPLARKIADFSFKHRDKNTGLLENNPTQSRWDKFACTTEAGLWGGSLLRAGKLSGGFTEWLDRADRGVRPYLLFGYDAGAKKYFGKLKTVNGEPVIGTPDTEHQPGDYSDIWRPHFPAHDYPLQFAECCLEIYSLTGDETYREGCGRWAEIIERSLPAREGRGGYAEHYGRCIHFLWRCGKILRKTCGEAAERVASEALDLLFDEGMFRGHPGEHRYDAVDGVGHLLLALLALCRDEEPDMMGSGW